MTSFVTGKAASDKEVRAQHSYLAIHTVKCGVGQRHYHDQSWPLCVSEKGLKIASQGLYFCCVDGQKMVDVAVDTQLVASQSLSPIPHAPLNMALTMIVLTIHIKLKISGLSGKAKMSWQKLMSSGQPKTISTQFVAKQAIYC
ncbi:unnamed protein product [Ilex paraguariensis]|uniref:Uncharacterized protein n=1 Tax=Ilex paraguariensis TaxID=185542 RepID=A0ABC8TG00_9AQUA